MWRRGEGCPCWSVRVRNKQSMSVLYFGVIDAYLFQEALQGVSGG